MSGVFIIIKNLFKDVLINIKKFKDVFTTIKNFFFNVFAVIKKSSKMSSLSSKTFSKNLQTGVHVMTLTLEWALWEFAVEAFFVCICLVKASKEPAPYYK